MLTRSKSQNVSDTTQGTVNLGDLRYSISHTRSTFTRVRTRRGNCTTAKEAETQPDFVTLVSLICNIYGDSENDLIPIQQFHPDAERHEDGGHTCIVSQRAISTSAASKVQRGTTDDLAEDIVVKRTRESVLKPQSSGLRSLINELSIRTHPPIRTHPNIVKFKGMAWDFEDDAATNPRPLLLEELAPQRSLEGFWNKYNFVRMTFQSKIELCLDVADGLSALHTCHIVHGDVKPENILIFPRIGRKDAFMAKLTDFGHSVSAHEGLTALPAFTPEWCAPEVLDDHHIDFEAMVATDVFSFGLVMLSIIVGRSYYKYLEDFGTLKKEGRLFARAMELVEDQDRKSHDSDFELDTIRLLLRTTLRQRPARRNLQKCTHILRRYLATRDISSQFYSSFHSNGSIAKLKGLNVDETVSVGYQTLTLCSHQLKSRIVQELETIALNQQDSRQHIAAWELSICYFSGFGVPQDYPKSSHWLNVAANKGIPAAEAFHCYMHQAMHLDPRSVTVGMGQSANMDSLTEEQLAVRKSRDEPEPFSQSDVEMFAQNATQATQHHLKQTEELQKVDNEASDYDSDTLSDDFDMRRTEVKTFLDEDIVKAVKNEDLQTLSNLITGTPECVNHRDQEGNTLLLIAARSGSHCCLQMLLDYESIDAGMCNDLQESALHLMSSFSNEQIRTLVPKLIAKGADSHREALPLQYGNAFLNISAKIRCCPILRAILSDNLELLSCLLEGMHTAHSSSSCRICEGGSRLKRIIAIALSTFRAEALSIILSHIKAYKDNKEVDISKIEVWSDQKLIPLWKAPFHSVIIKTIDLPESFFRAISYGEKYTTALHSTISFLLENEPTDSNHLYNMLQEAVKVNSLDSVNFILAEARRRQLQPSWWVTLSKAEFPQNPLIIAIKYGLRAVFERLWDSNRQVFQECVRVSEELEPSRIARLFPAKSSSLYTVTRSVNIAQICLSIAVTAAHQDQYFFNFILEHANPTFILQQPGAFENEISEYSTCFLAQAILTSSFSAATTILQKFPKTWQHRVRLQKQYSSKKWRENDVSIARLFPDEYLGPTMWDDPIDYILSKLMELIAGEYRRISNPTLSEYILLVGSYSHCRFLLQYLHSLRSARKDFYPALNKSKSSATKAEAGLPNDWESCPLTTKEFWCLMLGNLVREREDREALWSVIQTQVTDGGHPKLTVYLRLAIRHGTNKALIRLLDMGWQINGPLWAYLTTPYRLSTRMEREARLKLKYRAPESDWDSPRWGDLDTHQDIFQEYKKNQKMIYGGYEGVAKQNSETLRERGGRMPQFVLWLRSERFYLWACVIYALTYGIFLPFLLAFTTGPYWKWRKPLGQKLAWMYIWSVVAVVNPPLRLSRRHISFFIADYFAFNTAFIVQLLLQHFVPLVLIASFDTGGYGWFVPFCVFVPEVFIFLGVFIMYLFGGLIATALDGCCVLFFYCCGKGFRPGPFKLV